MLTKSASFPSRLKRSIGVLIATSLIGLAVPAVAAPTSIELPKSEPFPESVTSASDGTLFASSITNGGVTRVAPGSPPEVFIKPGEFGTRSTFGVNVDEKTGTLWVCSNDATAIGLKGPSSVPGAYLKGFDLKTGRGKASYRFPGDQAICNDIAFGADGSIYVTNTAAPEILRLKPDAQALEVWVKNDALKGGLDGIAFGEDGNLYVNTYISGELFRIGVKNGEAGSVTKLETSQALNHPDALKPIAGGFLMVEGVGRLDHVTVQGDRAEIKTVAPFAGPTGVTVSGDTVWISEGQLARLSDLKKGLAPPAFNLRSISLEKVSSIDQGNGGITLPPGFKATVFADKIGHARHAVVGSDGTVYVNTWSGFYYGNDTPPAGGFLIALKDTTGRGKADVVRRFGLDQKHGSNGGTGIGIYNGKLYFEINDRIEAYKIPSDGVSFDGNPEVIVSGLPLSGDHPMHPFIISKSGQLFVDVGSATNSCQPRNRVTGISGADPCTELKTRAGIWLYDASKTDQKFSPNDRYVTGLRNGEGFGFDSDGRLLVTQHGRDQLAESWGNFFTPGQGADLPAEEIVELKRGRNFGWPYCYYDQHQGRLMLAPEYGGDGKKVGRCADKAAPVAAFPAHWAPNDLAIYQGHLFPKAYRGGAFIAFHGSWNRAPAPQGGYNIVFQPLSDGKPSGRYVVFAQGFPGAFVEPGRAAHRPSGLAVGPDGALYITDDQRGRVWRVTYSGDESAEIAAAPFATNDAAASTIVLPPEGMNPEAGKVLATFPVAPGATEAQVVRGQQIFVGADGGTCGGCHGGDASGGPIGPDLTSGKWIWGDGSLAAIKKTILTGVPIPKFHLGAMPAKGGANLSDSDADALAAYVWAISRKKG